MTELKLYCPLCGCDLTDEEQMAARMAALGYLHADAWTKCPRCGYVLVRGLELEEARPPYWWPENTPAEMKKRILSKVYDLQCENPMLNKCPVCHNTGMQLHKVYPLTYRPAEDGAPLPMYKGDVDLRDPRMFYWMGRVEYEVVPVPSGVLLQFKCAEPGCRYVLYVSI